MTLRCSAVLCTLFMTLTVSSMKKEDVEGGTLVTFRWSESNKRRNYTEELRRRADALDGQLVEIMRPPIGPYWFQNPKRIVIQSLHDPDLLLAVRRRDLKLVKPLKMHLFDALNVAFLCNEQHGQRPLTSMDLIGRRYPDDHFDLKWIPNWIQSLQMGRNKLKSISDWSDLEGTSLTKLSLCAGRSGGNGALRLDLTAFTKATNQESLILLKRLRVSAVQIAAYFGSDGKGDFFDFLIPKIRNWVRCSTLEELRVLNTEEGPIVTYCFKKDGTFRLRSNDRFVPKVHLTSTEGAPRVSATESYERIPCTRPLTQPVVRNLDPVITTPSTQGVVDHSLRTESDEGSLPSLLSESMDDPVVEEMEVLHLDDDHVPGEVSSDLSPDPVVTAPLTQGAVESPPHPLRLPLSMAKEAAAPSPILNVWNWNLDENLQKMLNLLEEYPFIAVDSEFPGKLFEDGNGYDLMRRNVNALKLIQLGFTLFNEKGESPKPQSTFQFNFRFDVSSDPFNRESLQFLREHSGIDFAVLSRFGIRHSLFAERLRGSNLIRNPDLRWLCFHGIYDFGYFIKMLSSRNLPGTESEFAKSLHRDFPFIYDLKLLRLNVDEVSNFGGLQHLADELGVGRVGQAHQAGSDAHLTGNVFFTLRERYFEEMLAAGGCGHDGQSLYELGEYTSPDRECRR